jgi:hypothetical protein
MPFSKEVIRRDQPAIHSVGQIAATTIRSEFHNSASGRIPHSVSSQTFSALDAGSISIVIIGSNREGSAVDSRTVGAIAAS